MWSNPAQREQQVETFLRWLPDVLHDVDSIDWTSLPGVVMGYLIHGVPLDTWWGIPTVLSAAIACEAGMMSSTVESRLVHLRRLWKDLSAHGISDIAALKTRPPWDTYLRQPGATASVAVAGGLNAYITFAGMDADFAAQEEDDEGSWKHYLLPLPPLRYLRSFKLNRIIRTIAQGKRRAEVDVLLPLQHFFTNFALARKQAAHAIQLQYTSVCRQADAGEIRLPHDFVVHTTNPIIVDNGAKDVSDLQIALEEIDLPVTLWNRASWSIAHAHRLESTTIRQLHRRVGTFDPQNECYYLQFRCPPSRILWFGELIAAGLLFTYNPTRLRQQPDLQAQARRIGFPRGIGTSNGELLNCGHRTSRYLVANSTPSDLLVDWQSLYRGILYGTALAVISLTSAARTCEIQQISMDRWLFRDVPEIRSSLQTGRTIRIHLQHLLPKGYTAPEERQIFLISPEAGSLLMEIGKGLAPKPRDIPPARYAARCKAEYLANERYLFQWPTPTSQLSAASAPARVLESGDINTLIRFMFLGLELSVPHSGRTIRITVHLLRHVLATFARHRAHIPPEAVAFLLHHRVHPNIRTGAVHVGEATDYYSREPQDQTLARLDDLQHAAFLEDDAIAIAPITDEDLDDLDKDLRDTIEHWGTIGITALGFCKAGACIRREDRALCIGCPYLVVYHRMLPNAVSWRHILLQEIEHLEQQGNAVEARQRKARVKCLDGYISAMEAQIQILATGHQLPKHFALADEVARPVEVLDHAR